MWKSHISLESDSQDYRKTKLTASWFAVKTSTSAGAHSICCVCFVDSNMAYFCLILCKWIIPHNPLHDPNHKHPSIWGTSLCLGFALALAWWRRASCCAFLWEGCSIQAVLPSEKPSHIRHIPPGEGPKIMHSMFWLGICDRSQEGIKK